MDNIVTLGDGAKPYTISVDDIYLSILSQCPYQRRAETIPLWSARSAGSWAEYFEFEVLIDNGGDDAKCENARVERCHVCDIDVPVSYWEDHRRSVRHSACRSIADTSLERARKQVSLDAPTNSNSRSSTYFCPPCTCAVDLTNRNDHEQTQLHRKSLLHVTLLQSLATLYENKNNLDDICKDIREIVNKNFGEIVKNDIGEVATKDNGDIANKDNGDIANKDNGDIANKDIGEIANKDIGEIAKKEIGESDNDVTKERIDIKIKNEDVSQSKDTKDESNQKEQYVIIMTASKAKLKVSFDNYQGFCTVRGHTQCRVCRVVVDDKAQHLLNEEHRRIVEAVIKDKHCIRKLDKLYHHCILCNEVFEGPEAHILCSPQHKDFLKQALIEERKKDAPKISCYTKNVMAENLITNDDSNEYNYFCEACQVYIIKATLLQHVSKDHHKISLKDVSKDDHKTSLKDVSREDNKILLKDSNKEINKKAIDPNMVYCSVCDVYVKKGKRFDKFHIASNHHRYKLWLTEKDKTIHYHMNMSTNGKVVCQICDVQLYNDRDEMTEHVNSNAHQVNRGILLKDNYMDQINDINVHCFICNKTEYMIDEIRHAIAKSHLKKLNQLMEFGIRPEELQQIKKDPSHQSAKFKELLQYNRIENYDVSRYQCKVCFKCIEKTVVFKHIISKKHRSCRNRCIEIAKGEVAARIVVQENSDSEGDDSDAVDLKQSVDKKETEIIDKEKIDETALKIALQINQIEDQNEFYRCDVCDQLITKSYNIWSHISNKKHKENLDKYVETHNMNPKTNYEQDISSNFETINNNNESISQTIYSNKNYECAEDVAKKLENNWIEKRKIKNGTKYYCKACEAAIESGFEETHILLERHKHNITKINRLSANGVLKNGFIYYCTLCSESVKRGFEETHLISQMHKMKYSKNENLNKNGLWKTGMNYFCTICLESVQLGHESEHIKSEPHKVNAPGNIQKNAFKIRSVNVPADLNTNFQKEEFNSALTCTVKPPKYKLPKPINKLHYLFEANPVDKNQVTCLVCNINLMFNDVLMHRKDRNHREVYSNLMDSNTMFRIRHRCFCECCCEIMKVNCEYTHLTSERHRLNLISNTVRMDKKSLQELSLKMFNESIAAETYEKKTSRTNFTENDSDDCGEYRFENLKTCLFGNSSVDVRNDDDEEDNYVSDSNDSFVSARTDVTKEETQDLIPEKKSAKVSTYVVTEVPQEEVEKAAEFTNSVCYLFEKTKNSVELLCKLCHCVVANRSDMILQHIIGVKHTKKYESILLINELKETIDNRNETILRYRCQACRIDVEKVELFLHINSNKHKLYLTAKPSTSGSFQQTGEEKSAEVELEKIKQNNTKILVTIEDPHKRYLINKNSSNELYCKLCDSDLPDTDLNNHVNSRTHQMNFEFLLLENEVKKVGVSFFCDLCKIGLVEGNELEHVYGVKHKNNVTNNSLSINKPVSKTDKHNALKSNQAKRYVCTTCNMEILDIPKFIKIHNEGLRHKTNLVKVESDPKFSIDNINESKSNSLISIINTLEKVPQSNVNSEYFCEVCNVKVPNNPNNIKMHNDGGRHKSNLELTVSKPRFVSLLPASNSIAKSALPNIYETPILNFVKNGFCLVCKINVENKIESIRNHLKGKTHNETLEILKLRLNENQSTQNSQQIQSSSSQNIVVKAEINSKGSNTHSTDSNDSSNLRGSNRVIYIEQGFCHACKTKVPNNISCIKEHIKGKSHINNTKNFKPNTRTNEQVQTINQNLHSTYCTSQNNLNKDNGTKSQNKNPKMNSNLTVNNITYIKSGRCDACKIEVTNNDNCIEQHIMGRRHIQNVKSLESIADKGTDNATTPISNHQNNTTQPKIDPNVDFVCKICKLKVPNNPHSIKEHMKGTRHKNNIENLAKISTPSNEVETKGVYVNVPNNPNNIAVHLNGQIHKINVENLQSGREKTTNGLSDVTNIKSVVANSLLVDSENLNNVFSKISQLYDNQDNVISSPIVESSNVAVASVASTSTLDNVIDSHINSVSPSSCDNSNESANTESISNTIPTINVNIESANEYRERKIVKTTEPDSSNDATIGASVSSTSKTEDYSIEISVLKCDDTIKKTNISDIPKTENSNTETKIAQTSEADDASDDSVAVTTVASPDDDRCETFNNSIAETKDNQGFYVCNVCERAVPNNQTEIKSHLSSYHHLAKLKENKLKKQEGLLPESDVHYCDVCKENISNNNIDIKWHDGTEVHRSNFERMLSKNKIKMRDDKVCYCEACDLYFSKFTVKTHVDRVKHKSLLK